MEIYSIAKPQKMIHIGKSVADQKNGRIMQKELLSPVGRREDETGDSEIPKADYNEVCFDIVDEQPFDQTWQN